MNKRMSLVLFYIYPIVAVVISHVLEVNAFNSVLIFFGVPSLFITAISLKHAKKAALFSLITSIPAIIVIDYIAQVSGQWVIPYSILAYRLFDIVTIEVLLWAFLNFYLVIMFYEYFLDGNYKKRVWYPRMKYLISSTFACLILFLSLYFYSSSSLDLPYFYLFYGTLLIVLPVVIQMSTHSVLVPKFLKVAAYFFYLTFTYEVTALQFGWWDFPGKEFIGWVSIMHIRFPIEELVFWLILLAMAILSLYEFFDDDGK